MPARFSSLTPTLILLLLIAFALVGCGGDRDVVGSAERGGGTLAYVDVREFGAHGDGASDDTAAFQRCLSAVASGGTIHVPAGTYRISEALYLNNDVTLRGDGRDSRVLRPSEDGGDNILVVRNRSNVIIKSLGVDSDDATDELSIGVQVSGSKNVTLSGLTFNGLGYGIKIDGGAGPNEQVTVENCAVLEAWMPIYVSYTSDGRFTGLRLEAYREPSNNLPHNVYMSSGNHNLLWEDILCTGGLSYCFQLENAAGVSHPSSDITVKNLTMRDVGQGIVVGAGWENVVFDGITGRSSRRPHADTVGWITLGNSSDGEGGNTSGHVFRNFDFTGGFLLGCNDSSGGRPGRVRLEHGVVNELRSHPPDGIDHEAVPEVDVLDLTVDGTRVDGDRVDLQRRAAGASATLYLNSA